MDYLWKLIGIDGRREEYDRVKIHNSKWWYRIGIFSEDLLLYQEIDISHYNKELLVEAWTVKMSKEQELIEIIVIIKERVQEEDEFI